MTPEQQKEIFSKESLSIADFQVLFDAPYATASEIMRTLKKKLTRGLGKELRIDINGKIHTLDYYEAVGAPIPCNRYDIHADDIESVAQ